MPDLGYMTLCACVCLYLYTLMSMGSVACPCAMTVCACEYIHVCCECFWRLFLGLGNSLETQGKIFSPKNLLIPVALNLWPRPKGKHSTLGLAS